LEQAIRLYPDIAHLVVTCNAAARMIAVSAEAQNSCVIVLDDTVNDRGLAMTSSFTNMVVMGQCLAHAWSLAEYSGTLDLMVDAGEEFLKTAAEHAEAIAAKDYKKICMVGSGALAAVAKESALKVLEMTSGQIRTISDTVLGLRHGPMAALDAETLFICFVSQKIQNALYAVDLLREIESKGIAAEQIVVGPRSAEAPIAGRMYLGISDEIGDAYRPVIDVIFGQLLGLYCSLAHKLKPDAPSPAGVITRVVQGFQIY
jgi:tagatose-6-phosphate ketose/aldose isomerase